MNLRSDVGEVMKSRDMGITNKNNITWFSPLPLSDFTLFTIHYCCCCHSVAYAVAWKISSAYF